MTKNAPTVASTSATNTTVASRELDARSAVITDLHQDAVREWPFGMEIARPAARERAADRAAVADDEGGQRALRDVGESCFDARGVLLERLAAGEAEAAARGLDRQRPGPAPGVLGLDVRD